MILRNVSSEEGFGYECLCMEEIVTEDKSWSMEIDGCRKYVKEHIIPIPKSELVIGKEYPGYCRNSDKAIWNGKTFQYMRTKFGSKFLEKINHYEDDDGFDVFVPIKEI